MFVAAIGLSAVAGYYSVIGMTSIFAGAFIPIIIMTGILETSKVIVASWLYNNWKKTPFALKAYLSISVVILMCITSMGIFGYLSKAHIEQAAAGQEQQAQLARIIDQIATQNAIIAQANTALENVNAQGAAQDTSINAKIADANKLIDEIHARYQPQIDQQQKIIDDAKATVELRVQSVQTQIDDLDAQLANLDAIIKSLIDQEYASKAQTKQEEQKPIREEIAAKKEELIKQIDAIRNAPNTVVDTANAEIVKVRERIDQEIAPTKASIDQLTAKLNTGTDFTKVQSEIDAQNLRIKAAQDEIDKLTAEKFKIEGESRKLEVEVGPLKYIAEMIYGDNPNANLLEKAVRGVIMVIIIVFDPLAVLMLIAANQGLAEYGLRKPKPAMQESAQSPIVPPQADSGPTTLQVLDLIMPAMTALQADIAKLSTAITQPVVPTQPVQPETTNVPVAETQTNHTISFDSATNNLNIVSEASGTSEQYEMSFDEPVVRTPVVEDDITVVDNQTDDAVISKDDRLEWQLIDKLPTVTDTQQTSTEYTAAEFLDKLKMLHQQRLQTYTNTKTED